MGTSLVSSPAWCYNTSRIVPFNDQRSTMTDPDLILFLLQISTMLAVAMVFGDIMRRLRLPTVLGELGGGIVLGPTILGAVAPAASAWLFPPGSATDVARDAAVKLGMLFFLFLAGLQMDLSYLSRSGPRIIATSLSGIVVPFSVGVIAVLLLPGLWGPHAQSSTTSFAVFIGTALSISALPVIARILMDLQLLQSDMGKTVMSAATIDDLIGWSLFALILSNSAPGAAGKNPVWLTVGFMLVFFVAVLTIGRRIGQRALLFLQSRLAWPSNFIHASAIVVLSAAALTEAMGTHAVLGAYLVGVALAQTPGRRDQAHETIYQFVVSFFAPLYFVSIGLKANFLASFDLGLVVVVFLVACVGKVCGVTLAALLTRMPPREALAVGFGMNARGAMEMILASISLEYHLIDQRLFVALIIMALGTSILSSVVIERLLPAPAGGALPAQPSGRST
jgi:Kef-type K+ transport system membrane component KefB